MPQIHHYEVEVVVRFRVDGPLAHHEAVQAAEARVLKSLKGDGGPAYSDPVREARIISVTVGLADAGGARPGAHGALL